MFYILWPFGQIQSMEFENKVKMTVITIMKDQIITGNRKFEHVPQFKNLGIVMNQNMI
jgi:hypothetical protein